MKVSFITGATGFIGKHLLTHYGRDQLSKIKILSRHPHSEYETVVCDLQSEVIPVGILEGVDTVFHLAGFTHDLRDAAKIEHLYRVVNIEATIRLAKLSVISGVKKFIFVSSVKAGGSYILGEAKGVYGETKREAELKVLEIGRQSGMHVSIVRPSLVYGPGVKGNLALMRKGIEKGWFPPFPETGNRRSMIHVDDLVRAILLVAEDERANGEIFIATDGTPHSSREIYDTMCKIEGRSVPKWTVPKFLFNMAAIISPKIRYKVDKLLGDEFYSSEKLEGLGFKAQRTLKEMNETSF